MKHCTHCGKEMVKDGGEWVDADGQTRCAAASNWDKPHKEEK